MAEDDVRAALAHAGVGVDRTDRALREAKNGGGLVRIADASGTWFLVIPRSDRDAA
jgi:hypothetical protein